MAANRKLIRSMVVWSTAGERTSQEDFLLVDQDRGIMTVADGFGGQIPGAEAAKLGCESVLEFLRKEAGDADATLPFELRRYFSMNGNILFNALIHANRKVNLRNKGKGSFEKGGASIIAGYFGPHFLAVANVGTGGAMLIRNGQAVALTLPRSYRRVVDPLGTMGPDGGLDIPLLALGIGDGLEPEISEFKVQEGDWVILHTDGVSSDLLQQLGGIQLNTLSDPEAVEEVTSLLRAQQYQDNASLTLAIL